MMENKIGVVIVTYNRKQKLVKALNAYSEQSYKPTFMIIYNNASTDDTSSYLDSWEKIDEGFAKIVINSDKNIGGAGGFHNAIESSLALDYDWLWISDDDAYPAADCLSILNDKINNSESNVASISSMVYENGQIAYAHRRNIKPALTGIKDILSTDDDYKKESFIINAFSFVGTAIRKSIFDEYGLPYTDFFIWYDDTEYSLRINSNKKNISICCPKMVVNHDVDTANIEVSWKLFYGVRNMIYMYKLHFSKFANFRYKFKFNLSLVKNWFTNKKIYMIKKDAKKASKNRPFVNPEKYRPGVKI